METIKCRKLREMQRIRKMDTEIERNEDNDRDYTAAENLPILSFRRRVDYYVLKYNSIS